VAKTGEQKQETEVKESRRIFEETGVTVGKVDDQVEVGGDEKVKMLINLFFYSSLTFLTNKLECLFLSARFYIKAYPKVAFTLAINLELVSM
jgi:hypothetical protein